jgi:aspartate racemase
MVGGASWVSTVEYYRHVNSLVNERAGGVEAANIVLWSLNFGDLQRNNIANDSGATFNLILEGCKKVEAAGAEAIIICASSMHRYVEDLQPQLKIPIIDLRLSVAQEAEQLGLKRLLLIGTRTTMEDGFCRDFLESHGIEVLIPNAADRDLIHRTIFEEMGKGLFRIATRQSYREIINRGVADGAEGVIMGCTEIPILLEGEKHPVPFLDSTFLHSRSAVEFILEGLPSKSL